MSGNLYAICLVKNEDDIIGQTLTFATRYCDKIFVIDNGSTDRTWEIVKTLGHQYDEIVPFVQTHATYDDGLRWLVYEAQCEALTDDDWWLILDGDEFLAEDPRPIISRAMSKSADIIVAWQIQFYFTERDLAAWDAGKDSRNQPIIERRRYYRIDYQEPRLFRNQSKRPFESAPISRKIGLPLRQRKLKENGTPERCVPTHAGKIFRERVLNRHYQYRDPEQIQSRLRLRYGQPSFESQAGSVDWRSKIVSASHLDYYEEGKPWRFHISIIANYYLGKLRYALRRRFRNLLRKLSG
jgi:glycosyltransferase involved in cell wall biosynthesis